MSSAVNFLPNTLRGKIKCINSFLSRGLYICILMTFMGYIRVYSMTVKMSGDIEIKAGHEPSSSSKFSICHWNLNNIFAHNFIRLTLSHAYICIHNFDILCLSENNLTSIS